MDRCTVGAPPGFCWKGRHHCKISLKFNHVISKLIDKKLEWVYRLHSLLQSYNPWPVYHSRCCIYHSRCLVYHSRCCIYCSSCRNYHSGQIIFQNMFFSILSWCYRMLKWFSYIFICTNFQNCYLKFGKCNASIIISGFTLLATMCMNRTCN